MFTLCHLLFISIYLYRYEIVLHCSFQKTNWGYFLLFYFVLHFCLLNDDFYMELYCYKKKTRTHIADISVLDLDLSTFFFFFKSRPEYWICSIAFVCLLFFSLLYIYIYWISLLLLCFYLSLLVLIDIFNWRHIVTS